MRTLEVPLGRNAERFEQRFTAVAPEAAARVLREWVRSEPWSIAWIRGTLFSSPWPSGATPAAFLAAVVRELGPLGSIQMYEEIRRPMNIVSRKKAKPVDLATLAVEDLSTWVEFEFMGSHGERYPGASVRVRCPTGPARREVLGSNSRLRVDGIAESGTCRIELLDLGEPTRGTRAEPPGNATIVLGGPPVALVTGRVHRIRVMNEVLQLRIRGLRPYLEVFGAVNVAVVMAGSTQNGVLEREDQVLEVPIPAQARAGTLTLMEVETYRFSLGDLPAARSDDGATLRLFNLGWVADDPPDLARAGQRNTESLRRAVADFQRRCGLEPTEEIDDATEAELELHYAG